MGDWRYVEGVLRLMVMWVEKHDYDHDVLLVQVLLVLVSKNAGTLRKGMPVYNLWHVSLHKDVITIDIWLCKVSERKSKGLVENGGYSSFCWFWPTLRLKFY